MTNTHTNTNAVALCAASLTNDERDAIDFALNFDPTLKNKIEVAPNYKIIADVDDFANGLECDFTVARLILDSLVSKGIIDETPHAFCFTKFGFDVALKAEGER